MSETIMIVDDEPSQLRMAEYAIREKLHYQVVTANGTEEAMRRMDVAKQSPALVLLDLVSSEANGLQAIQRFRASNAELPIIVLTRYGDHAYATKTLQAGASDFLPKPVEMERLKLSMQHCLKVKRMSRYIGWLERKMAGHVDFGDLVGQSQEFTQVVAQGKQAATSQVPVWIEGETGVGKEMLARAIHGGSDRAGKPLVVVHCHMLPEHMAEALLFGQEKPAAAANGAHVPHFILGKLREADRGTLLLKEIGSLRPEIQQRLLATLERGAVTPIGASAPVQVDVRVMCTSCTAVETLTGRDMFSPALYKKLRGLSIALPPIRNRKGDIALMAEHFLCLYSASENKHIRAMTERAALWLTGYAWPGNLRQIAHVLWRAVAMCERDTLDIADMQVPKKSRPVYIANSYTGNGSGDAPVFVDAQGHVKKLKSIEEEAIRFALNHSGGCMTRAVRSLGIGRSTLYRKLGELGEGSHISRPNHATRPMMKISPGDRS